MNIERIISGGQTGADQGGLDAAIALGVTHGGWCPKGRRCETGRIPPSYQLEETPSREYPMRTRMNVQNADGTVIFTSGPMSRGSELTLRTASRLGREVKHINLEMGMLHCAEAFRKWLDNCEQHGAPIRTLNVAGTRESKSPGIQRKVRDLLVHALQDE